MKWNVSMKLAAAFGLSLVIFIIAGVIAFRSATSLAETADMRRHSHEVIAQLAHVLSDFKDLQTGQRGYVITGDESYLAPYTEGLKNLEADLKKLRSLTAADQAQQRRLDQLDPLVQDRLKLSKEVIEARKATGLEA